MQTFNDRLNSTLISLNLIHLFFSQLEFDYEDLSNQDQILSDYFETFSKQSAYLSTNCLEYGLIDKLDWDKKSESPVFSVVKDFLGEDNIPFNLNENYIPFDTESSLNPVLLSLTFCVELIESLNELNSDDKLSLIHDDLFQLNNYIKYLIFRLINCDHCTSEIKSNITVLIDIKIKGKI